MFFKRFRIGSLLGIPINLDLSWFLIVVALSWMLAKYHFPQTVADLPTQTYWAMGISATLGLFLSVLLHELGHAVAARRCGLEMRGITLFIFGGVAEMSQEPGSPRVEFIVAIAGPLVTLGIMALTFAAAFGGRALGLPEPATAVVLYLAIINTILLVFNMVPAFPLDGGRVLRAILWQYKGSLRWATGITSNLGSFFGLFLMILGVWVFLFVPGGFIQGAIYFFIGMFLRNAAAMSYQQLLMRRALEGEPVGRFMTSKVVAVQPDITLDELVNDYIYRTYHKLFPVVDNGSVSGCITTNDVKNVPRDRWGQVRVAEVARECSPANTIKIHADAMDALSRMSSSGLSRLMVVDDDGRLVGILSLKDLLGFLSLKVELEEHKPIRQPLS